jgi:tRNA-specific 2-thiouridylase
MSLNSTNLSMLAARVLMDQGVEVIGITFTTPFFSADKAIAAARQTGFPLTVRDITGPHLEVVKNPLSGYGANMNPCVDCHALMIQEAGHVMDRERFDFIFTGEVLGQRPMSQNRGALNRVVNLSGRRGLVLRPLSALLLQETIPEQEGKVDREKLYDIQGRSRKSQFDLAEKLGIQDYPSPAGGCLLTDPSFSRRLRDLLENGPTEDVPLIEMLKVGRHFRIRRGVKAVVGRNQSENRLLLDLRRSGDTILHTVGIPGPTVLLSGSSGDADRQAAAALCARYSDAGASPVPVVLEMEGKEEKIQVSPMEGKSVSLLRV